MRTQLLIRSCIAAVLLISTAYPANFDLFRGRVNTLWNRASTFTALTNRPAGETPVVWTPPFLNVGGGTDNEIYTIVTQTDGKAIIGGFFTVYNGTSRNNIARINTDGSIDTSFDPGTGCNNLVHTVAVQQDGKILIGGFFTTYNGTARNSIVRVNTDGTLDASFNPGSGADDYVKSIVIQTDGKLVIGGNFSTYNGTGRSKIARVNSDGSLDASLNPGTGPNLYPSSLALQTDGKIILAGLFSVYNGTSRASAARINTDGTLDLTFNLGTGFNNTTLDCAVQSDGKIIIVGNFTAYNGTGRNYIARVNTDGSIDASFIPGAGADTSVYCCKVQSDGKIVIGGTFSTYGGTGRNHIARVNTDGSLDSTFDPGLGCNNDVYVTALQSDGKVLLGGIFTAVNGVSYLRYTRLKPNGSLDN